MLAKKSHMHACAHILLRQHRCAMNETQADNALLAAKPPSVQVTVRTYLAYLRATAPHAGRERPS